MRQVYRISFYTRTNSKKITTIQIILSSESMVNTHILLTRNPLMTGSNKLMQFIFFSSYKTKKEEL